MNIRLVSGLKTLTTVCYGLWKAPPHILAHLGAGASIKSGSLIRPCCIGPTKAICTQEKDEDIRLIPIASIRGVDKVYSGRDEFGPIKSGRLILHTPYKNVGSFERNAARVPLADDMCRATLTIRHFLILVGSINSQKTK
jgi:hypothetical protein